MNMDKVKYKVLASRIWVEVLRNIILITGMLVVTVGCVWGIRMSYDAAEKAEKAAVEAKRIAISVDQNAKALLAEQKERREQNCNLFESDHKRDVEDLRRTYEYLGDLNMVQLKEPLNELIIRGLSRQEGEAKTDKAPAYCDEPGVALPEPDPVIPKRPNLPFLGDTKK